MPRRRLCWWDKFPLHQRHPSLFLVVMANAVMFTVLGLGFLVGPKTWVTVSSFRLVGEIMPIRLYGVLFIVAGFLHFVGGAQGVFTNRYEPVVYFRLGAVVSLAVMLMFIASFVAVLVQGAVDASFTAVLFWASVCVQQVAVMQEPASNPVSAAMHADTERRHAHNRMLRDDRRVNES